MRNSRVKQRGFYPAILCPPGRKGRGKSDKIENYAGSADLSGRRHCLFMANLVRLWLPEKAAEIVQKPLQGQVRCILENDQTDVDHGRIGIEPNIDTNKISGNDDQCSRNDDLGYCFDK
jgi:hypothetical protein